MLKASVLISTWNRRELLVQLLVALANQTMPASDFEVIVCDSGSTDGTRDSVLELTERYKNLHYVNVSINTLAVKRNAGIRAAQADILIFMDDDAIPDERFVDAHVNAHRKKRGVVCCGQIRYPAQWIKRSNYFRYRDSRHLGPSRSDVLPEQLPPWMITVMNLSFEKTEFIAKVGYVSEEFTRYGGEDTELGFRIAAAGIRLVYVPEACVIHFEHQGSIKQYYRKLYINSRHSAPVVYRLAPEFLRSTPGGYIERIYADKGVHGAAFRFATRFCLNSLTIRLGIRYLEFSDKYRFMYSSFLYRCLTALAVTEGIRDRTCAPESSSTHRAWFE